MITVVTESEDLQMRRVMQQMVISNPVASGGSDICRKAFWQWVFTRIEPKRSRLKNEIDHVLGEYIDAEKTSGRPVRLVRSRVSAKAAKLLFKELVKVLCPITND